LFTKYKTLIYSGPITPAFVIERNHSIMGINFICNYGNKLPSSKKVHQYSSAVQKVHSTEKKQALEKNISKADI